MEFFIGRYPFLFTLLLFLIGLYGILGKQNLVKKLIGMNIMQAAVILFFIVHANKWNATVPVRSEELGQLAANYMNPIPHTLMLTAIVVSVATTGVALSLIIKIYRRHRSFEEPQILSGDELS
jgi:multicomponent Na+:H+ antiporter subunit C